jgi:phasin family protein
MDDAAALNTAADAAKQNAQDAAAAGRQAYAAGADAMKTSFDRAASAGDKAFKDAADKSLGALNELNAQSKRNFEAMIASVTAATRGAEALGAQAVSYAKSAMEGQVEHVRALTSVRSLQEAMELQSSYAKQAMETYVAEMTKAGETLTAAVKDSVKPLNTRATEAVESIQSVR